jgi:ankyrin repeat protein
MKIRRNARWRFQRIVFVSALLCSLVVLGCSSQQLVPTGSVQLPPLVAAAKAQNEPAVRDLLSHGTNVNESDTEGRTALMYAVRCGNDKIVATRIAHGANVNQTYKGADALIIAAAYHDNVQIAMALIAAGTNLSLQDLRGNSALMWAAEFHPRVATTLISAGADVNLPNSYGGTPLMNANNEDLVKALLAHGARLEARTAMATPRSVRGGV